jgi:benzoyl-CoA reductase/2-hydroxyglutaryl-CoA dehydratase subunit BcrC/BadD/HgdB
VNLPSRKEIIRQVRGEGKKIAAVLPIHYPRALLRAFAFHPIEVWGPPGINTHAQASHFQEYTCAIVRNATSFLSTDVGKLLDCILVPHTCDSLQGMGSIFKSFLSGGKPVLTIYHPRGRGQSQLQFLQKELEDLAERLRPLSDVDPSDADLIAALDIEGQADAAFAQICLNRDKYSVSDRDFFSALRSREFLPTELFLELAQALPKAPVDREGIPLLLSGIVPEPMELFDHLNEMGGKVVVDDLACCGRRVYEIYDDANPFRRMARQMMSMPPDPTVGASVEDRCKHLVSQMEKYGAKGAVVYNVKFCEPELFYLPLQRKALEKRGWPLLYLETDLEGTIPFQVLNRIQSFLEMLR